MYKKSIHHSHMNVPSKKKNHMNVFLSKECIFLAEYFYVQLHL